MIETTKTCTKCGSVKSACDFYADRRRRGALRPHCKDCIKAAQQARPCQKRTPEQRAEYRRRRGEVTRPYRPLAEIRAEAEAKRQEREAQRLAREEALRNRPPARGSKEWYRVASQEEIAAYRQQKREEFRRMYAARPAEHRARVKRFKHANPDLVSKWHAERQAHLDSQSDGTLTLPIIAELKRAACDCPYCGKIMGEEEKALDHVVPLSRGGWHSISNVVVCCEACNLSKHARSPDQWRGAAAA